MWLQMKKWQKATLLVSGALVVSSLSVVAYLVATHKPGLTVFIENAERRVLLEQCLVAANVQFEVTDRGGFRAKPGSVQRMEAIWKQFDDYRTPSLEFCRTQRQVESRY